MNKKNNVALFLISIISYFIVAISIASIPFANSERFSFAFIFCEICIYLFLFLGISSQIVLSKKIKQWEKENYTTIQKMDLNLQVGLISLFKNLPGKISDILFSVSTVSIIVVTILTCLSESNYKVSGCMLLGLLFFSFCSHCIFNGKNYFYLSNQKEIEKIKKN